MSAAAPPRRCAATRVLRSVLKKMYSSSAGSYPRFATTYSMCYCTSMNVEIARIDKDLPLPEYHTKGAAAFDLIVRENTVVKPKEIALIPANVIVKVPEGYALLILPRSSLPRKKSLVFPHSVGLIDQDYHGPEDELKVQVQNIGDSPVTIERGERIAQGLFVKIDRVNWKEVSDHGAETRGGFGSTD